MIIRFLKRSVPGSVGLWLARKQYSLSRRHVRLAACLLVASSLLTACVGGSKLMHGDHQQPSIPVYAQQTWHLEKLENSTHTAAAPQAVSALLQTHLLTRDVVSDRLSRGTDAYRLEGEVMQWHYRQAGASRPFIELRLSVRDIQNDQIIRTDTLSEQGSRRQSLTMLADQLLTNYVEALPLQPQVGRMVVPEKTDSSMDYLKALGPMVSPPATLAVRRGVNSNPAPEWAPPLQGMKPLAGKSVAFYYGANPPVDELMQFDRLILEPDNIKAVELTQLSGQGAQTYAYVSVGEVGKTRSYASSMDSDWLLGTNSAWDSRVLDLANKELRRFLVRRVGDLAKRGYDGVFLDTMDSFNLVAKTPEQQRVQRAGLVSLIKEFATAYPDLKIITNRGFEVLDDIAAHVDAVVAESLYSAWNNDKQRYQAVEENDRQWLLGKLNYIADKLDLEVIVVDYVAPSERIAARRVASRIASHGFIPWVANESLDYLGVGALEVVPRKVLMLFDGALEGPIEDSNVHRFVAMPIEYLGYVPEYLDVSKEPLPAGVLKGRYAGIVTWATEPFPAPEFQAWMHRQMDDTLPVAFLGQPPVRVDNRLTALMGVSSGKLPDFSSTKVAYRDDMIRPERKLAARVDGFPLALTNKRASNTVHMRYQDDQGVGADAVVTGSFGGFALTPGDALNDVDYRRYWVVDPFQFLETALQLPRAPQPDVTTENGRRLWLAHIDGDALASFAEMPGKLLGAEVLYDEILTRYDLPHTISVVEGEMVGFPKYLGRSKQMFDVARRTFRLDNVELASHTYSHPFFWSALNEGSSSGKYNLPIAGYKYNDDREVAGSIDFINKRLAPPGKKTEVMLWSGDAIASVGALESASRSGVVNMNGGFTSITRDKATMSLVTAMARPVGGHLQVYAPVMNENVYTNHWTGPFDGFRDVIDTFKMTETPRRLKPINVYYHFYSGTKHSALRALKEVYVWSTAQDIFPLYVSDYAQKVPDFRRAGVARYLDGAWKLTRLGSIRSLRVLGESAFPQLAGSQGISGARELHDGVYVHTDGADKVMFKTSGSMSRRPHLVSSNGRVRHWKASSKGLEFRVTAEAPVSLELGGSIAASCVLDTTNGVVRGEAVAGNILRFTFTQKDTGNVILNCPA